MISSPPFLTNSAGSSSVLVNAVAWIQGVLLGPVATGIAVVAIAAIGFGMLTGRVDLRRGATVVMGCFILFGASNIVAGLQGAASGSTDYSAPPVLVSPPPASVRPAPSPLPPYDPYAGASAPVARD